MESCKTCIIVEHTKALCIKKFSLTLPCFLIRETIKETNQLNISFLQLKKKFLNAERKHKNS